jgi:xanthine/uracil/vitamin C permease (AzgA family)
MTFCTIVWWAFDDAWPSSVASLTRMDIISEFPKSSNKSGILLTMDLLFLYILTLSGLVSSLSTLAALTREDNTTPRNRWLFVVCGLCTVLSGMYSGPPILVSPASASGIKAGARTGLSTVVCGDCFGLAVFFEPVLREVPHAATAPLLIAVGVVLFQNVHKLNWKNVSDSMPAYFALFFIPFTYSILQGVAVAYVVYIILGIFTGDIFYAALDLYIFYFGAPPFGKWKAESFHLLSRIVSADAHTTRRSCSQPEGRADGTPPHYPPAASEVRSVDGVTTPQSSRQQSTSGGGAGGGAGGGGSSIPLALV